MPESAKSDRYLCDMEAIKEPAAYGVTPTGVGFGHWFDAEPKARVRTPAGWDTAAGGHRELTGRYSKRNSFARETKYSAGEHGQKAQHRAGRADVDYSQTRNKRSVWTIPTQSFTGAHFATFPEALVEPCILAGSPTATSCSIHSWARARWPVSPSAWAAAGSAPN